ncbi:MAG: class I adenylate-forming enzyme family protein [Usitatibacter sp.]
MASEMIRERDSDRARESVADKARRLQEIPALWAAMRPDAVVLADGGREYSWSELQGGIQALARRLQALGVRPGDRVMLVAENCAPLVALLFAVVCLDAWVVIVNARLSAREIDAIRAHCSPRCTLFVADGSPEALAHAARHGAAPIDSGGWGRIHCRVLEDCRAEPVDPSPEGQVAALVYTTGTTGDPKAVMLTHASLLFIARASASLRGVRSDDRVYGVLPMSHVYGLASVCIGSLMGGARIHLAARFSPAAMAAALARDGITVCQGVPAMYAKLLEHLEHAGARLDAPKLRAIYAGGSPLAPALKRAVESAFGLPLLNGFGLTEASPTVSQVRAEHPRDDCSVGHPLPGVDVRVVDGEGRDVAPGEPGELWVHGPNVMKGYYRDPEATATVLRPGGWLATGDIARIGPDGALYIEGRLKELIIRSGFNVYPVEVEAVLNAHPEVTHSAVVGREVEGNEEVVAFVELVPNARATPAQLLEFAAASLAPYKRPAEIVVMAALPATATGKVLKGRLAQIAQGPAKPR